MESQPFLSVIIPCFNEADRLPDTLAILRDWLEVQTFSVEFVAVDDGSLDGTAKLLQAYVSKFAQSAEHQQLAPGGAGQSSLKVISYAPNQGKGQAVITGMLQSSGKWRLFMDADMSTPIDQFAKFLPYMKEYEIVIGSRYLESESIKVMQPMLRRWLSRGVNLLVKLVTGIRLRDTQCGFKLFSERAAKQIFSKVIVQGWLFDVELLVLAKEQGLAVKEVAVDWFNAKQSKLRPVKITSQILQDLTRIHRRKKRGGYKT